MVTDLRDHWCKSNDNKQLAILGIHICENVNVGHSCHIIIQTICSKIMQINRNLRNNNKVSYSLLAVGAVGTSDERRSPSLSFHCI